jgi:hypothetical protein
LAFFGRLIPSLVVPGGQTQITNNPLVTPNPTNVNSVLSFIDTGNSLVMTPERADVIEKAYFLSNSSGAPSTYYFIGDELMVYPESTW